MRMRKRITALVLSIVMMFSLGGCDPIGSTAELIGSVRNMGTHFTVCLDRAPSAGGLVRVIVIE